MLRPIALNPCRRKTHLLASALVAALAATLVVATPATTQEANRHGIFLDTVDVNIINIEVTVMDRQGNPVHGLTREDFELYEDGQPIEISNFYAVEDGIRRLPAADGDPAAQSAASPVLPAVAPPPDRRFVILFVDNGNIAAPHRQRVFGELRRGLDQLMNPADEVMVVSQDGQVSIEQPFTSKQAVILEALDRLEQVAGQGNLFFMESRRIQRDIESAEAPIGGDTLSTGTSPTRSNSPMQQRTDTMEATATLSQITSYAQSSENHGRTTMKLLELFIDSLAGLPGRKAIVYVSDGLELLPGEFLFRFWDAKYASIGPEVGVNSVDPIIERYSLQGEFNELISTANANRVAFYTIEGGSKRGAGDVSAEQRSTLIDPLTRTADGAREESMRSLAYDTGGVAVVNNAGIDSLLGQLEEDFNSYYSLGYPSPHSGDGKYHRVEVKVRREGVRLRYLEGYQDKNADDRMSDRTMACLLHDVVDNPLGIEVEIGSEQRKRKKGFVVPVIVKIPMSKLVLIPQDDAHLGRVSIFLAVRDEEGRLLPPRKIDVPVRIPDEQFELARSQKAGYAAELHLRAGEQKIAIGVRDELAAVVSTMNLNIRVGNI